MSLPIEFRDDLAHSLGGTGGSRDDVLMGTAAVAPGLATGAVHCLLSGCVCVDSSLWGDYISQHRLGPPFKAQMVQTSEFTRTYHETLLDAKVIMDDFGQGGQAVGGAGGVAADTRANMGFTRLSNLHQHGLGLKLGNEWMGSCMLPDNGHAGGVILVLINTHDKHWSVR